MMETLHDILGDMRSFFEQNGWNNLFGLALLHAEKEGNKVLVPQRGGDYTDVSISDKFGNYVYIRANSAVQYTRDKSCGNLIASIELRAVGIWSADAMDYGLADKLISDLTNYHRQSSYRGAKDLKISLQQSLLDGNEIHLQETGHQREYRALALAAVDFEMKFILPNCQNKPQLCPAIVAINPCD